MAVAGLNETKVVSREENVKIIKVKLDFYPKSKSNQSINQHCLV